jgi:very-short-patch-repair endonuclease
MTPEAAINEIARSQFGLFTRAQAVEKGATDTFLQRRVARQVYRHVRRGVYAVDAVAPSWHQRVLAVCLSRIEVVAARRTAAALWEMPGFPAGPLEFCSVRNVRSRDGINVRRVRALPTGHVARVGPIPATSPTRTILDLSSEVTPARLETVLDYALRRGLTSVRYLRRGVENLAGQVNIRASVVLHLLHDRSVSTPAAESPLETKAIQALRRSGLPEPVHQHEIWNDGAFVARVDLAYPPQRIAIEVDGYEYHSAKQDWERDLVRRNALEGAGWRVLHVTDQQLRSHRQSFVEAIRHCLEAQNGRQLSLDDS